MKKMVGFQFHTNLQSRNQFYSVYRIIKWKKTLDRRSGRIRGGGGDGGPSLRIEPRDRGISNLGKKRNDILRKRIDIFLFLHYRYIVAAGDNDGPLSSHHLLHR